MDTIHISTVANKLNVSEDRLKEYDFFVTYGDAYTPQRFWKYVALKLEEYKPPYNDCKVIIK